MPYTNLAYGKIMMAGKDTIEENNVRGQELNKPSAHGISEALPT